MAASQARLRNGAEVVCVRNFPLCDPWANRQEVSPVTKYTLSDYLHLYLVGDIALNPSLRKCQRE